MSSTPGSGSTAGGNESASSDEEPVDAITRAFRDADAGGSGSIDADQLHDSLHDLGLGSTMKQTHAILGRYDADRNGLLELEEYRRLVEELRFAVRAKRGHGAEIASAFRRADVDGSHSIDAEELHRALDRIGIAASLDDVRAMLRKYDADRSGVLELDEFSQLVNELRLFNRNGREGVSSAAPERAAETDIAAAFREADADGSGGIDVDELHGALLRLGLATSLGQTRAIMATYDVNGDGVLELDEFTAMVLDLREFFRLRPERAPSRSPPPSPPASPPASPGAGATGARYRSRHAVEVVLTRPSPLQAFGVIISFDELGAAFISGASPDSVAVHALRRGEISISDRIFAINGKLVVPGTDVADYVPAASLTLVLLVLQAPSGSTALTPRAAQPMPPDGLGQFLNRADGEGGGGGDGRGGGDDGTGVEGGDGGVQGGEASTSGEGSSEGGESGSEGGGAVPFAAEPAATTVDELVAQAREVPQFDEAKPAAATVAAPSQTPLDPAALVVLAREERRVVASQTGALQLLAAPHLAPKLATLEDLVSEWLLR